MHTFFFPQIIIRTKSKLRFSESLFFYHTRATRRYCASIALFDFISHWLSFSLSLPRYNQSKSKICLLSLTFNDTCVFHISIYLKTWRERARDNYLIFLAFFDIIYINIDILLLSLYRAFFIFNINRCWLNIKKLWENMTSDCNFVEEKVTKTWTKKKKTCYGDWRVFVTTLYKNVKIP